MEATEEQKAVVFEVVRQLKAFQDNLCSSVASFVKTQTKVCPECSVSFLFEHPDNGCKLGIVQNVSET
jgi:hypothetical protein